MCLGQIKVAIAYDDLIQLGRRFLEWVGFKKKVNPEFDYSRQTLGEFLIQNGIPFKWTKEVWDIIQQPEYTYDLAVV